MKFIQNIQIFLTWDRSRCLQVVEGEEFVMFCIQANQTLHSYIHAEMYSFNQAFRVVFKFSETFLPLF